MNSKALTQDELNLVATQSLVNEASGYSEPICTTYDLVKAIMAADMPAMPQMEPYFHLTQVNMNFFDDVLKPTRNILIVDIDPSKYTQVKAKASTDNWSKPQALCRIQSPSQEEFVTYWLENGQGIREWFVNQELKRQASFYKGGSNKDARAKLEKYRYDMLIPSDFMLVKDTLLDAPELINDDVHVVWCCNNKGPMRRDLIVYSYPYIDANAFTIDQLNAKRDAVLSQLISGSVEGSYMGTEYRILPPVTNFVTHNNAWCAETHGLWKMKNGEHMGGPFVSLTRVDEMNMQIITIEGFVFAPGKDKRNPLRQLEAMLYSLLLPHEVNEIIISAKTTN
jgi:hypothetical protein